MLDLDEVIVMVYGFVKLFLFVFSVNMLWLFVGFFYGKYGFDFFILRKFVGDLVWFVKKMFVC